MKKQLAFLPFCLLVCIVIIVFSYLGSQVVTVMAEKQLLKRKTCIILDPGHGGIDGGAVSCTGIKESQINLELALRLRSLLQLLGYETQMIRETDISVYTKGETIAQKKISDLKHRVKLVNEIENGLLLSIHQNTFGDSRYYGPQIFYAKTETSKNLAERLQSNLNRTLSVKSNRLAKQASGVYLFEHIKRPAVLIECGFLSNPQEEALLRSPSYQKNFCSVISITVAEYLSNT